MENSVICFQLVNGKSIHFSTEPLVSYLNYLENKDIFQAREEFSEVVSELYAALLKKNPEHAEHLIRFTQIFLKGLH